MIYRCRGFFGTVVFVFATEYPRLWHQVGTHREKWVEKSDNARKVRRQGQAFRKEGSFYHSLQTAFSKSSMKNHITLDYFQKNIVPVYQSGPKSCDLQIYGTSGVCSLAFTKAVDKNMQLHEDLEIRVERAFRALLHDERAPVLKFSGKGCGIP